MDLAYYLVWLSWSDVVGRFSLSSVGEGLENLGDWWMNDWSGSLIY
jgi:hypothetical protein